MAADRVYICIDIKSFYASAECVERGLDPFKARLIVADEERTAGTICLAVTPAMKALGVKNRCRVFEIQKDIEYITAKPRMALYIDYSTRVYSVYLKYAAPEDIHVYSIDEVFIDASDYLSYRGQTPEEYARMIISDVTASTGLYASCGIGSNLYLAKIAMDIISKHSRDGIATLDEAGYRRLLWQHRPITDFWRIGGGTAERLKRLGISSMGELAAANPDVLYKIFGVDAELLIDHAWGRESTTMEDIKNYVPKTRCLSSGQVLCRGYSFEEGRIIIREMAEKLAMELFDRGLCTDSISIQLGYSYNSCHEPVRGSLSFGTGTCSVSRLTEGAETLYRRIMDGSESIRRVNITLNNVLPDVCGQYDMFTSADSEARERRLQRAVLDIRKKYGGNGIFKGLDLCDAATALERNRQIGGHRA